MAATDQLYRNQKMLDVVFGASCLVLLLGTGWMMYDDHNRPFKPIQRTFRDVETSLYQRLMLDRFPEDKLDEAKELLAAIDTARKALRDEEAKAAGPTRLPLLDKAKMEAAFQDKKATYDSEVSLLNIAVDDRDAATDPIKKKALEQVVAQKQKLLKELEADLQKLQSQIAEKEDSLNTLLYDQRRAEVALSDAEDKLKRLSGEFERTAKTAAQKSWGFGNWLRQLPIIDGFASPYRIQQYTLNDLTIDYGGFQDVPRYDRCTTCHLGIDRPAFTTAALAQLADAPAELKEKHNKALKFLKDRASSDDKLGFSPGDIGSLMSVKLSPAEVRQYAAHPRLDLFVDANSPHSAEKFGCTTCHAGQGSATEFTLASHFPNDSTQSHRWTKEKHWAANEYWEFPMLPARFVESSCLKCHHQVTDLVRYGSREEAPKLLRGYNLVRENGCFGCHEIAGVKSGKAIGPDMRLEPTPPLDSLTPEERSRALADTNNPPGTMRKVGPSLRRLSEKTTESWTRAWIDNPRGFRADTRMPHFYNLSTNHPDVLPEDQKKFPAAEIHAITHYLFRESNNYLDGKDAYRKSLEDRLKALEGKANKEEKDQKEIADVKRKLELAPKPARLSSAALRDGENHSVALPPAAKEGQERDAAQLAGRRLFTERGCLACHAHEATEKSGQGFASLSGEAHFGPNLSRMAAKFDTKTPESRENSRRWLVQWVLNPNVHFSRTRMPITHLTVVEASQVAEWLLGQKADYSEPAIPAPELATLKELARLYVRKAPGISPRDVDAVLESGVSKEMAQNLSPEADELLLQTINEDSLKFYIGKKSISRMGCFGCHDIPGFESAKPIGTALNDWGRKDPHRLAFEDAAAFIKDTYHVTELRDDPKDRSQPAEGWTVKDGKRPYEEYFEHMMHHGHQAREGFLHLKLMEPRSYDYHREVKWDDRLRMPQFAFAPVKKRANESDEAYSSRAEKAEAEGREAVMTFILGLVAEPVHARYLHTPAPDKAAEARGRQVLEKFNCVGCHQVRPGVYDVTLTEDVLGLLQKRSRKDPSDFDAFHAIAAHNAWTATAPQSGDSVRIFGVPPRKQEEADSPAERKFTVRLSQALSVVAKDGTRTDVPAGTPLSLPYTAVANPEGSQPYGGAFSDLLLPHLEAKDRVNFKLDGSDGESDQGRAAGPPTLVREGEKVQPDWLFRFLKQPHALRPLAVLRMPKFNMSDEEAQALVNYFSAVDRSTNPSIGLTAPYVPLPQRDETYWREKTARYVSSLGKEKVEARFKAMEPAWKLARQSRLDEAKRRLAAAKVLLDSKDDAIRTRAKQEDTDMTRLVADLEKKGDFTEEQKRYLELEAYAVDAHHLLSNKAQSLCLQCHRVGTITPDKEQGPPLELAWQRLRPDWVARWIANPQRLLTYKSVMPKNFDNGQDKLRNLFDGTAHDQVEALRDALMNYPRVTEMPGVRYGAAPAGAK